MTVEPKVIRATRYVCPGCHWSSSRRATVVDHLTRCWRNPDNRACLTCAHYDRGICCDGYECGCHGEASPECAVGVPLPPPDAPIAIGCPLWTSDVAL